MSYADAGPSTNSKAPVSRGPSNLRFQRRTSERAFYEGALREGGMEYPGSGSSPWASSPDASRTSFQSDVPRADLPGPAMHQEGEAGGSGSAHEGDEHREQRHSYQAQPGGWSPEQQHQWQQHQQQSQQVPVQPDGQRGSGEENRRPQSARYHNVPPQQRQHMPQYKLQAKIMGLERSGKKDPILKFDVYVCCNVSMDTCRTMTADRSLDQPSQVQNNSIPRYPSNTQRIPKTRISPDGVESRSACPCCPTAFNECRHRYRRR